MRKKAASQAYAKLPQSDIDAEPCKFVNNKIVSNTEHDGHRRLLAASLFCVVFIAAELVGGYMANSLAVMNEAIHQVFDLNSLLTSLLAAWIASWKPNNKKTFGYYRAEVVGACAVILLLWLLTGILAYEAILRIVAKDATTHGHGHHHVDSDVMMLTAGLAFCANVILTFILNIHPHNHGNNHCETSLTVKAAFLHTLGDLIHSLGVFIAAVIIKIKPSWQKADPVFSLVGAFVVLVSTYSVLRDSISILLEGVPHNIRIADVRRDLCALNHVTSVHNVHVWCLTAGKPVLSAHVLVGAWRLSADECYWRFDRRFKGWLKNYHIKAGLSANPMPFHLEIDKSIEGWFWFPTQNNMINQWQNTNLLDVNSFLWETTQKMTSKYNFHHSSIQIEFRRPDRERTTSPESVNNKLE